MKSPPPLRKAGLARRVDFGLLLIKGRAIAMRQSLCRRLDCSERWRRTIVVVKAQVGKLFREKPVFYYLALPVVPDEIRSPPVWVPAGADDRARHGNDRA